MSKVLRLIIVVLLTLGTASLADIARAQNEQTGDIESNVGQGGASNSGDAVGGQVVGVVSSGDASVDSTNRSDDVDVETGDANAFNNAGNFTGQLATDTTVNIDGAIVALDLNTQEGDNSSDVVQAADATSGDGVGGQVIGVVTSAGGSADVVADNTSENVDVETGDASADNIVDSFVGQVTDTTNFDVDTSIVSAVLNSQEGDNSSDGSQAVDATSGDGVGGQVLGIVSAGDSSVDATNHSEEVDIETGDATAENFLGQLTGQLSFITFFNIDTAIVGIDLNTQEGDNSSGISQVASATTGDGVGGQVAGVVTSAGGSADVVAANTSEDVVVETGDAFADNEVDAVLGQASDDTSFVLDTAIASIGLNTQEGDASSDIAQAANATSGDGVGGQVLGVVSAGDASVDATNESTDVDIDTGDADADNFIGHFTGQVTEGSSVLIDTAIVGYSSNTQDGDNSSNIDQAAAAASGDGVGGQIIGVVTSAGGSADVVAANTSEEVDEETGDAFATNESVGFFGQNVLDPSINLTTVLAGVSLNEQEGDNSSDIAQAAGASSGDGVGGQVLGIVSAGDTSIDATNESTDVDGETGDAFADNFVDTFAGQFVDTISASPGGIASINYNTLVGDISSVKTQEANATSGDAVSGQVAGVVTSVGGSADLVLANASDGVSGETGLSEFVNEAEEFVGQQLSD